jgi:hypothetical protein
MIMSEANGIAILLWNLTIERSRPEKPALRFSER